MTWQPIESAPRDGTPILAWSGYVWIAQWELGAWWPYDPPCDEKEIWAQADPLHWMPLPKPPE